MENNIELVRYALTCSECGGISGTGHTPLGYIQATPLVTRCPYCDQIAVEKIVDPQENDDERSEQSPSDRP